MTDAEASGVGADNPDLEDLLVFLHESRGFDFTGYKRGTLSRRIEKRMQDVGIESYADYRDRLELDTDEWGHLFDTILINVTAFFRDSEAWEFLAEEVVPKIVSTAGDEIRVWSAGCASGEEAYSIAMIFTEALGVDEFSRRVKIYGTDVDEEALDQARRATYTAKQLEAVPEAYRSKYFTAVGDGSAFRADVRRSVIFGRHDLTRDAPISRLDLLVCRNTLMYLNAETQAQALRRVHFALKPTGYLFLGRAEMLLSHHGLFAPEHPDHRVFLPVGVVDQFEPAGTGGAESAPESGDDAGPHLVEAAHEASQSAELVVDAAGIVVAVNREARSIFGVTPHSRGRPLRDLELSYRPAELRGPIEQALAEGRSVELKGIERVLSADRSEFYDVVVTPLHGDGTDPQGVSVSFVDVTELRELQLELTRLKEDLETANEELQSTNEELETTNEELQSTNEELQTTNEELQSTNEELETTNEELHATNEQLEITNVQLHERTRALDRANEFMESILASISSAVVVLDANLVVQVWNEAAEDLWGLAAERVIGHSFFGLDVGLPVDRMREPIRHALDGATGLDEVVIDASDRRGTDIRCRITSTLLVYGEHDQRGVVLWMEPVESNAG